MPSAAGEGVGIEPWRVKSDHEALGGDASAGTSAAAAAEGCNLSNAHLDVCACARLPDVHLANVNAVRAGEPSHLPRGQLLCPQVTDGGVGTALAILAIQQ